MARQREFDKQKVLHAAAETFSSSGYAGSSIDMLVDATGLQRGSIYKAFSSKAGLFSAALSEYVETKDDTSNHNAVFTDLLIVAIWERANVDKEVFNLVLQALEHIQSNGKNIPETFYKRMSERAKLPTKLHEYNEENIW